MSCKRSKTSRKNTERTSIASAIIAVAKGREVTPIPISSHVSPMNISSASQTLCR
jgi:hypothetical protein